MDKLRIWTARLLTGFLLISIGFAIGRRTAPQQPGASVGGTARIEPIAAQDSKIVVYAAHMTFRCSQCNRIEWFARELVENEFQEEMADERLTFKSVDYIRDTEFARHYNISSSTIVVSRMENGKETGFDRLDEVWTKVGVKGEFMDYVRSAIRRAISEGGDA